MPDDLLATRQQLARLLMMSDDDLRAALAWSKNDEAKTPSATPEQSASTFHNSIDQESHVPAAPHSPSEDSIVVPPSYLFDPLDPYKRERDIFCALYAKISLRLYHARKAREAEQQQQESVPPVNKGRKSAARNGGQARRRAQVDA